jgi:hypothetical protein
MNKQPRQKNGECQQQQQQLQPARGSSTIVRAAHASTNLDHASRANTCVTFVAVGTPDDSGLNNTPLGHSNSDPSGVHASRRKNDGSVSSRNSRWRLLWLVVPPLVTAGPGTAVHAGAADREGTALPVTSVILGDATTAMSAVGAAGVESIVTQSTGCVLGVDTTMGAAADARPGDPGGMSASPHG